MKLLEQFVAVEQSLCMFKRCVFQFLAQLFAGIARNNFKRNGTGHGYLS